MRVLVSTPVVASLFMSLYLPIITAITLNQFQPIYGFSQDCVNVYNTPLSDCTAVDLQSGVCSTTCIAFLEALTQLLRAKCGDSSANQETLIQSFFNDQGTSRLCPNVLSGGDNEDGGYSTTIVVGLPSASPTIYTSTSRTAFVSSTIKTTSIVSVAPTTTASSISTSSSSASVAATTTQFAIVKTTVAPSATLPSSSFSSIIQSATEESAIPTPSTSTSSSGGGGGEGGSPLDVGSSSSSIHNVRVEKWALALMAGSAGLALIY